MTIIIRNGAVTGEHFNGRFAGSGELENALEDASEAAIGLDVEASIDPEELVALARKVSAVRIGFASFADGRGFSLAARLRREGFTGLIRASGHVISDQYPMAVRSGFDEVEISEELFARQPASLWAAALKRVDGTYLDRLAAARPARQAA